MRLLNQGARRASLRSRLGVLVAASVFASLFAFGVGAAAPSAVAAASPGWHGAEAYYLGLLNCTRTGGWVQKDGSCAGYGTGHYSTYVAPIKRAGVLNKVARPWARYLARHNRCYHSDPGARLRVAGLRHSTWGENIGCGSGYTARQAVLAFHRMMQAEKSSNGPHWRNIKNPSFKTVGIGVWKDHGRTRLVTDFYRA